jgi:putative ABC transport system substrate-binding protein
VPNFYDAASGFRGLSMRRREFIPLVCAVLAGWPATLRAQQATGLRRVGYLSGGTEAAQAPLLAAFRRGMRELGYAEGGNFSIETRYAEGRFDRLPSLARELLGRKPEVLLVQSTPANLAAKAATQTVPIVMVGVADPLGVGLIANLARPGGNITGITNIGAELAGKRLEILKEIVPAASKVAVLLNSGDPISRKQMDSAGAAARKLAIELDPVLHIRREDDLMCAFEAATRARAGAALRMIDPFESALRRQTAMLAAQHRLPVMYPFREAVELGGLAS